MFNLMDRYVFVKENLINFHIETRNIEYLRQFEWKCRFSGGAIPADYYNFIFHIHFLW